MGGGIGWKFGGGIRAGICGGRSFFPDFQQDCKLLLCPLQRQLLVKEPPTPWRVCHGAFEVQQMSWASTAEV
jgi:hypothetical protein